MHLPQYHSAPLESELQAYWKEMNLLREGQVWWPNLPARG